jgi:hypothetical protein
MNLLRLVGMKPVGRNVKQCGKQVHARPAS